MFHLSNKAGVGGYCRQGILVYTPEEIHRKSVVGGKESLAKQGTNQHTGLITQVLQDRLCFS